MLTFHLFRFTFLGELGVNYFLVTAFHTSPMEEHAYATCVLGWFQFKFNCNIYHKIKSVNKAGYYENFAKKRKNEKFTKHLKNVIS